VQYRDILANDAVAVSVRSNDATVTTEISYDILGRVSELQVVIWHCWSV
jgi:hypothetical protein